MRLFVARLLTMALIFSGALALGGCKKKTPDDRLQEAVALLQQNQVPLAVLKLKDVVSEYPDEPAAVEARFVLADVYMQLGRKENLRNALEQLEAVRQKVGLNDERGFEALHAAAQVHLQLEEFEEALALIKSGVDGIQNPQFQQELTMVYNGLLMQAEDPERQAQGIAWFRETALNAEELGRRGQAREVLADFLRRSGRYQESTDLYAEYMAKYPEDEVNPQLIMAQALNYRLAGDMEKSEELFTTGSAQMIAQIDDELNIEERTRRLTDMSRLYETVGKLDEAEAMLRRIMAEQPGKLPALTAQVGIGEMYARNGRWDDATALFTQIARENEGTQIAQNANGMIERIAQARAAQEAAAAAPAEPAAEAGAGT